MRRTKIVCTLGPTSEEKEVIVNLVRAGMNVARLNMSHSTHQMHEKSIALIREIANELNTPIGILADLQGPKIRVGTLKEKVILEPGQQFILTTRDVPGNAIAVSVSLKELPESVHKGQVILLDDGLLELVVDEVENTDIYTTVVRGGELKDHKGINLPNASIKTSSITQKDISDLEFVIKHDVDMVALSFVRTAQDVVQLRSIMEEFGGSIPIISKIEKHEAVTNIDDIIAASYGIMVARGDLGIEIPIEQVPIVQKMIIEKCNQQAKPVITATQMLDSMIRNPIPTRAEATDVANAVFDGTDALMLSGETAFGQYPVDAAATMAKIAQYAEDSIMYKATMEERKIYTRAIITDAIALSASESAKTLGADCIITATQSGYTARKISKYKPQIPVIAVTTNQKVVNQLSLSYGVVPVQIKHCEDINTLVDEALNTCKQKELIHNGDLLIITAGILAGVTGGTNVLRVYLVANEIARGIGYGDTVVKGYIRKKTVSGELSHNGIIITDDIEQLKRSPLPLAVITSQSTIASPIIHFCREHGIPVIGGIAIDTLPCTDGDDVTLDILRGTIYRGNVHLPF
ncbi:MAG TPA: pyruvate kinase [Spirochaetota bacterium]|nr:pyruvate kinase [Spirochaetota bacterium]HPD05667.1 pyruvate kinase [Spirochaetota bacterium]HQG41677.1 pyruvate kinase [Spirochaetota bacterium]HQI37286.1 pyruvate kinase [Spirochaetota bacterium]HQK06522.1 pyruvate kinase [Spirochaetota bacterium]